jgi:hypothetical protein
VCTPCSAGSAAAVPGLAACSLCAPGTVQGRAGSSGCDACPPETAAPEAGSTACLPCPLGYDALPGSATCGAAAAPGYYLRLGRGGDEDNGGGGGLVAGAPPSAPCPAHASCAGGLDMPVPAKGFWVDRSLLRFAGAVQACPRTAACDAPLHAPSDDSGSGSGSGSGSRGSASTSTSPPGGGQRCWAAASTDATDYAFDPSDGCGGNNYGDEVLCTEGSSGPLCGSCKVLFPSRERV